MIWRYEVIEGEDTNVYTQYGGEFTLLSDDPERIISWFKPLEEGDDYVCPGCTDIVIHPHVCDEEQN
jgi:hypothetical protein